MPDESLINESKTIRQNLTPSPLWAIFIIIRSHMQENILSHYAVSPTLYSSAQCPTAGWGLDNLKSLSVRFLIPYQSELTVTQHLFFVFLMLQCQNLRQYDMI